MRLQTIQKGTYIVAVSGGVDSMVLLDLLASQAVRRQKRAKPDSPPILRLIVAHFDHGIREDSAADQRFVKKAAKQYGLTFESSRAELGPDASEATARQARYQFLWDQKTKHGARAIITAHHRDDMLETAILNMLRGTGRMGLSSLKSRRALLRPLLNFTKKDIMAYSEEHDVKWREDVTNADERYLRNYIRHKIMKRLAPSQKNELLNRVESARNLNQQIDDLLEQDLNSQPASDELNRSWYTRLPYAVAGEIMAAWLRRNGIAHFDRSMIEHLVTAAKTARPGKQADIDAKHNLEFKKDKIRLNNR